MKHPAVQSLALTLGIFDWVYFPADASQYRLETVIPKVHWDRIPKLFSAPTEVADQAYKWLSDFDDELFLSRLFFLLGKLGFSGGTFEQDPKIMAYLRRSSNNNEEYEIPFFQESPADDVLIAGGIRLSGVPANGNLKPGFAIFPYLVGSAGGEIELGNGLVIEITSLIDLEGGASIIFRPPKEITFHTEILSTPTIPANGMLTLALKRLPEPNDFIILFGRPGETRLTLAGFSVLFSIRKTSEAMEVVLEGEAKTVSFVVTSENGDGFLQKVLPKEFQSAFDLALGWSNKKGLYFRGSAGLEATLSIHKDILGVLKIESIYLALFALSSDQKAAQLELIAAVSAGLKLGPFSASVERIGLRAFITFPEKGGNLGPAHLTLGFKPPDGAGMSINASAITGGGYLLFDQEKEQYAGILYLAIKDKIAITAIGLLTTRMPDGRKGFSLLLIITAEFPPIQLGYGFVLLGVGGLIGVNRTMLLDVLRAGIKNKTLDSILFPKNPIANAPKIISDLQAVFPPAEGRFVFGPMAKIAWGGAYPILTIELGILIELGLEAGLPASVRLALLGKVTLALPRRQKPEDKVIVYLNLDIMGLVDFDKSDASVDATLFDSLIAEFPITGDMAMRLNWGASSTFVMAAGGFHPRFQPPPNFPALDRLAISIVKGDNPRLRLESYMAITANTVQFGARLDIYVAYAGFTGAAFLAFDALAEFPFHVVVDIAGGVVVKWKGNAILTATLYLTLSGPGPWSAVGEATFHFLGFKRQLPINLTSGEVVSLEPLPPSQPFVQLQNQFKDAQNWSAQLPAAENMNVTLRQVTVGKGVLVHPLGSLTVRQTAVPLDVAISRFANTTPDTPGPFVVEKITFGNNAAVAEQKSAEVRDNFAPAQFFQMSDEEKLGSPAFQPLLAGRTRIGTMQIEYSEKPISRALGYDTVVIDALETRAARRAEDGISAYAMPSAVLTATALLGAAGQSLLRSTGSATYAGPTDRRVKLKDPEYMVVSTEDMSVDAETGSQPSEVEARQRLQQKGAHGYQVVGSHEVI